MPYFRVKILELLLYLDALELGSGTEKPYFYRSQVETVKAIRSYLAEHLDQHITLEALSRQYQIPLTTMKACFKSVYGSPVNTYMRALRMDRRLCCFGKNRRPALQRSPERWAMTAPANLPRLFGR